MDSATEAEKTGETGQPIRLSESTANVYQHIVAWCRNTCGNSPSIRELMRLCGISSTSVVSYHLRRLTDAGLIYVAPGASRGIMLVGAQWIPPTATIVIDDRQPLGTSQMREYWSEAQRKHRAAKRAEVAA